MVWNFIRHQPYLHLLHLVFEKSFKFNKILCKKNFKILKLNYIYIYIGILQCFSFATLLCKNVALCKLLTYHVDYIYLHTSKTFSKINLHSNLPLFATFLFILLKHSFNGIFVGTY
jgi:hypothetical protein